MMSELDYRTRQYVQEPPREDKLGSIGKSILAAILIGSVGIAGGVGGQMFGELIDGDGVYEPFNQLDGNPVDDIAGLVGAMAGLGLASYGVADRYEKKRNVETSKTAYTAASSVVGGLLSPFIGGLANPYTKDIFN